MVKNGKLDHVKFQAYIGVWNLTGVYHSKGECTYSGTKIHADIFEWQYLLKENVQIS